MTQPEPHKKNNAKPLPASLRAIRAALRGQTVAAGDHLQKTTGAVFPVSAAKEAEAKIPKVIGQPCGDKGIYIGTWKPEDRDGNSLNQTFNLYAAPEDLDMLYSFNWAVNNVANLENWQGYDGFDHNPAINIKSDKKPDEALYDALRKGTYKGEWFIPPLDALSDNLYRNKDKFDPAHQLVTKGTGYDLAPWYWSSTESLNDTSSVMRQCFVTGECMPAHKNKPSRQLSTRLVRAEPVTEPPAAQKKTGKRRWAPAGIKVQY